MERVMLTMPAELIDDIDALARQTGEKRSQLVRRALHELLEQERRRAHEALLAEGYRELGRAADVEDTLPAQAAAADGIWRWDE